MEKFRTFYGVRGEARKGLTFGDKSRTRQEFLKESLTSTIIDRFAKTGILTPTVNADRIAQFGDFSQVPSDLLEAHQRLENVKNVFGEFPADVRSFFGNNPINFVQFMANPANKEKAIELGLIAKPSVKPAATPAAEPAAEPAATPADTSTSQPKTV